MNSKRFVGFAKFMHEGGTVNSLERALEVSELRYRRLFETAQYGILILDATTGKIIDANPFLLDLLDYPFESMIGLHLWEIGQFKDIAARRAAFDTLQTNEYIRYENLPLRTKSGREIQVEFVSNAYYVGADKVIQCNIRDITVRSKAEAASHGALELAAKARGDLLAILAHELRTPLAAISCAADLIELEQNVTHALGVTEALSNGQARPESDQFALTVIRRNVRALVRMINELFDLTHIVKGTVEVDLASVDVHEIMGFALRNLASQERAKGIKIDSQLCARHSRIRADAGKLEQVFSNLIGNALKFTPTGGEVSVVRSNEPGSLVIGVRDSGIGISAEAMPRIFRPFEQQDLSIHLRFGGLGLSIAQTYVKAHRGSLEATSEGVGKGAKFIARFPLEEFVAPADDDEMHSSGEAQQLELPA